MIRKIFGILEIPFVYDLSQTLLAPGATKLLNRLFKKVFQRTAGLVLDVGCGPKLKTPRPEGLLVGVDINPSYIRKYTGGFLDEDPDTVLRPPPGRNCLGFVASADTLPFPDGVFEEARSSAFFHHVDDSRTARVLGEMRRCLRPGGRIVVWDAALPQRPWARPLAWLTFRMDRGRYMRTQEQLLRVFQEGCPGEWRWERHTYTYTGMELLFLQYVKK